MPRSIVLSTFTGFLALTTLLVGLLRPVARAQDAQGSSPSEAPPGAPFSADSASDTPASDTRASDTRASTDAQAPGSTRGGGEGLGAVDRAAPLPSFHVGELASRTRAALHRARPLFRTSDDVAGIARRLAQAEREVALLSDSVHLAQIPQLSPREVADQRAEWRRRSDTFRQWQATLSEHASELETVRNELVDLRRRWAELRRYYDASGGSEARRQRILDSLAAIRAADDHLEERLDEVLALQERVSELAIAADDVFDQLRSAAAAYRERLFVRDHPPLWAGLRRPGDRDEESLLDQAHGNWRRRTASWPRILTEHLGAFGWQLAVFAALAVLLRALAHRSRSWPADDESLRLARRIAARPYSAALLVTLLATPVVVPNAPVALYDAVYLVTLWPLVRVLLPLASPPVRSLLLFLAGFLVVNRIEVMVAQGDELDRIDLLVESLLVSVVIGLWAARAGAAGDRMTRVVRGIAIAVAAVLGAALIANVLGYVFLASTLVRGTGFSVYGGLALVTLVVVARVLLDLAIRSEVGRRLHTVREHGALIHRRVMAVITFVSALVWVFATLGAYGFWPVISRWAEAALEYRWQVGTLDISLGAILVALLILAATFVVARFARFVLEIDVLPRLKLEPGVDGAISGLTRYVIVGAGLLLALAALGIDAGHIALVAGALGVGVGFGLQGIVANFIAGIVLMLERPVRLGDFIEVGPLIGRVERIGLRSSTVRALDGAEVIVPNESLISREVVNWTLSDRKRRIRVKVGVAYGTDPKRVLAILERVAAEHAQVLRGPPPQAFFEGFGSSSLDFVLQFWTEEFTSGIEMQSKIGVAVHDALKAEGIEIPFPQHDVHVKSLPPIPGLGSEQTPFPRR